MLKALIKTISIGLKAFFILAIIGSIGVISIFYYYGRELPDYRQLESYDPPLSSRIYAQNGKLIQEYADEKRVYIEYNEIPPIVIKAFLAAEDRNFFHHHGIDYFGIARAALKNISSLKGKNLAGGSTITQQVVKNFLLSNERSLKRKIKEAILAYRISNAYSKERILELYLNQIFLGNGSYGLFSAALNYFNKDIADLNIAEAALLAALPKAPSQINPIRNRDRALIRRNWVIESMLEEGFITKEEATIALSTPIELNSANKIKFAEGADFYAESVRLELIENFGSTELYQGGYNVVTYMNEEMQKNATNSLRKGLENYDKARGYRGPLANIYAKKEDMLEAFKNFNSNSYIGMHKLALVLKVTATKANVILQDGSKGTINLANLKWARKALPEQQIGPIIKNAFEALSEGDIILVKKLGSNHYSLEQVPEVEGAIVVMEVGTGKVLALTGGYSFNKSQYNRATQSGRQPGSAFKPMVYLSALENGYEPNTIIEDAPISVSQGPNLPMWTPKNYKNNFLGEVTMRYALEKSLNVPTVNIALDVGVDKITEMSQKLGIFKNPPQTLSIALGAYETTLLRLVNAYNILASAGEKTMPRFIDHISDRKGQALFKTPIAEWAHSAEGEVPALAYVKKQIIDPGVSYQVTSMLKGAVERGTAIRAKHLKYNIAGKTGTTNDSLDAWFIGYTPDIVVGVYVGYDQPKSLGERITGANLALPIFIDFMKKTLPNFPNRDFPIPKNIRIVDVYADTGEPVSDDKREALIIKEAFLQGEPIEPEEHIFDSTEEKNSKEVDNLEGIY